MSILIRGMEMPHDCDECRLCAFIPVGDYGIYRKCLPLNAKAEITIRRANCPLIPVPPHGRLIDADALTDAIDSTDWYHQAPNKEMVHGANRAEHQAWYKEQDIYTAISNAPTIIPASEEGET